ncbi:hypothetical protein CspHIS471_0411350 [Cutaneotrichosporon sp. HIS471]|nr:hypothetical protein CspHIS471_0411350 [Cutaneotrichosporon sp. HIS471]
MNLKVLRILSGYRQHHSCNLAHYTAPVMVMFGRLPEYDSSTKLWYLWPGDKLPRTQKVVWTISSVALGLQLFLGSNVSPYTHQVENAVIHFRRCHPARDVDKMFSWLAEIAYDIVAHVVSGTVTIVDLDRVPVNSCPIEDFEERRFRLVEQLGEHASRVKFMTGSEYCIEYGLEQYRIETCEKLE